MNGNTIQPIPHVALEMIIINIAHFQSPLNAAGALPKKRVVQENPIGAVLSLLFSLFLNFNMLPAIIIPI